MPRSAFPIMDSMSLQANRSFCNQLEGTNCREKSILLLARKKELKAKMEGPKRMKNLLKQLCEIEDTEMNSLRFKFWEARYDQRREAYMACEKIIERYEILMRDNIEKMSRGFSS